MAKMNIEMSKESGKIQFCSLKDCELFVFANEVHMKIEPQDSANAICLEDGMLEEFEPGELCTYVQKAELKLTI